MIKSVAVSSTLLLLLMVSGCGTSNNAPLRGSFHGVPFNPKAAVAIPHGSGYVVRISNRPISCGTADDPQPGRITVDLALPVDDLGTYSFGFAQSGPRLGMTSVEAGRNGQIHFTSRNVDGGSVAVVSADAGKLNLQFAVANRDVELDGAFAAVRCQGM